MMKSFLTISCLILLSSCFHLKKTGVEEKIELPDYTISKLLVEDTTLLMRQSVSFAYQANAFQPFWFDSMQFTNRGDSMIAELQRVSEYALNPEDFKLERLTSILGDTSLSIQSLKQADVLLTDNVLYFFAHLQRGPLSEDLLRRQFNARVDSVSVASLMSLKNGSVKKIIAASQPGDPLYHLLKDSLSVLVSVPQRDTVQEKRLKQIVANMQRQKWIEQKPERYIEVNIPAFLMRVFEEDSVVLESNVIVGKPDTRTPVYQSVIKHFIIYPYWHVPRSIATKELLPKIQEDSTYLVKHRYEVLDRAGELVNPASIPWAKLDEDNFPYVLRQREGYENTLGIIKFVFTNPYGVYLHDTNSRRLFKKPDRALSHGCVRVQKAVELAKYLTKDDSVYVTPDDLLQYLQVKQRLQVDIVKPIPVLLRYRTAELVKDGLKLYGDIYDKDLTIYDSLFRNRKKPIVPLQ